MRFFIGGILGLLGAISAWATESPRSWGLPDSMKTLNQASMPHDNDARFTRAIGISLDSAYNGIVITEVFLGMPAFSAGLCKGDKLVAINNRPIATLLSAIAQTQNIKADFIMIDVERKDMRICRRVEVQDGRPQFIGSYKDGRTLSLAISVFGNNAAEQVSEIVKLYAPSDLDTVIFDLRDNEGGSRYEAQKIARLLGGSQNRSDHNVKFIVLQREQSSSAVSALADMLVQQHEAEVWGKTAGASTAPDVRGPNATMRGTMLPNLPALESASAAPVQWNMADFRERHPLPTIQAQEHPMMMEHNNIAPLVWGINGNAFAALDLVRSTRL